MANLTVTLGPAEDTLGVSPKRADGSPKAEGAGTPGLEAGEAPVVFGLTLRTRRTAAGRYEARVVEAWNARGEGRDPAVARRRAVDALRDLIADRVLEKPPGLERYPELESDLHLLVQMTPGETSAELEVEITHYGWAAFTSALALPESDARERVVREWASLRARASSRAARDRGLRHG